ncbi:MAG: L-seryl-tRNA(Ser) seleniumtransferase [Actinomycetota bacterium]|nr:L-seryl-tRNA(Ser) seleniumtransferase [Actinomycetota bacterium]
MPGIDAIVAALEGTALPRLIAAAARAAVNDARERVKDGADAPTHEELIAETRDRVARIERARLTRVVNATGVLIHTNLGRAPLGQEQLRAALELASGYSNLEFDLDAGKRDSRHDRARELLTAATGAEDALVVNNNAAAVLLTLVALCNDKEVIISRGELIEIGGEFRIPDVLAQSGARLVEVGTTNRTHLADYERAIGPETAAILKVHPSNYRIVGFAKSVATRELAKLARGRGVLLFNDLGSGLLSSPVDGSGVDVSSEPIAELALEDGTDIVMFSGDKLMGGPQAGVIAGRAALLRRIASHPMARALRVDKLTLATLQATLLIHLEGRAEAELPLWRMIRTTPEELKLRAHEVASALGQRVGPDVKIEVREMPSVVGGGSLPGVQLKSWGLTIAIGDLGAAELQTTLRTGSPPVIGRVEDDLLILDLRTVLDEETDQLIESIAETLAETRR